MECAAGTLFLDEVAELPPDVQGELLTFLDDQRYKRLGDDRWSQATCAGAAPTATCAAPSARALPRRPLVPHRRAHRGGGPLRERPEDVAAALRARTIAERPDAPQPTTRSPRGAALPHPRVPVAGQLPRARGLRPAPRSGGGAGAVDLDARARRCARALDPVRARTRVAPAGRRVGRGDGVGRPRVGAGMRGARAGGGVSEYVEEVLKPLFFARKLDVEAWSALPDRPTPSYEEMGRRMAATPPPSRTSPARYVEIRGLLERSPQSG